MSRKGQPHASMRSARGGDVAVMKSSACGGAAVPSHRNRKSPRLSGMRSRAGASKFSVLARPAARDRVRRRSGADEGISSALQMDARRPRRARAERAVVSGSIMAAPGEFAGASKGGTANRAQPSASSGTSRAVREQDELARRDRPSRSDGRSPTSPEMTAERAGWIAEFWPRP